MNENNIPTPPSDATLEPRQKLNLIPGKHYSGSFWLNEYGEIHVQPTNEGSRPGGGAYSLVHEEEDYSIYESKNFWKVSVKLPKAALKVTKVLNAFSQASWKLANYVTKK